jgi:hypothetical protein
MRPIALLEHQGTAEVVFQAAARSQPPDVCGYQSAMNRHIEFVD